MIAAFKEPNILLPQPTNRALIPNNANPNGGAETDDDMDTDLCGGQKNEEIDCWDIKQDGNSYQRNNHHS